MADHNYVPRRAWDTGEAPYTIRQSAHLSGCARCGGSPLSHGGPGGVVWWRVFAIATAAATIIVALAQLPH